jgi:hypothetical protein
MWIATVFPNMVFIFLVMIFSKIICLFFFNIELVENYKCSFFHKTLWITIVFRYMVFFIIFFYFLYDLFSKLSLLILFFLY